MSVWSSLRRREEDVAFLACVIASLAACAWIVYHVQSPLGDLIGLHSDHLHHVRATWTFWKLGFEVYRTPFGITAPQAPYPFVPRAPWPDFPIAYPPGMFAVFAVPTWVGATYPTMAPETFAKLTVFWVVLLSHLGLAGVWRALSSVGGGRSPLLVAIWLLTWRMCLHGFYDAIWVGCAAMSISSLARRRPELSLIWFAIAMLVNYRAASIAPAAAWAAWQFLRSDTKVWRKVTIFAATGAVGVLVLWTFWLFTKGSPPHTSAAYQSAASHLAADKTALALVWVASGITALLALGAGDVLVAITVLWATVLTIPHAGHSWHGTILVGAALLVGATRRPIPVAFLRNVLALWVVALWELVFDNPLFAVVHDVFFRAKFK